MKKLAIIVLIVAIGIGLIAAFILLNSKPDKMTNEQREKAISEMLGRKANTNPNIKTGNTTYNGKYAQFEYPAAAVIYGYKDPSSKDEDTNSESFSFDIKNPRLILNYNASATKEIKIEDIPAVKFRNDPANDYAKSQENVDDVVGVSYKKDRSGEYMAEKSTFLINDGYLYTISITGSSPEDVEKLHKQIMSSVVFK